ncbi:MAG: hypothetical protein WC455_23100 [Dehalococcoidia bacterium]|jgi:hypothetical protein
MTNNLTLKSWLSKHGLILIREERKMMFLNVVNVTYHIVNTPGSFMQSVVLYPTANEAVEAYARMHGIEELPNFEEDQK